MDDEQVVSIALRARVGGDHIPKLAPTVVPELIVVPNDVIRLSDLHCQSSFVQSRFIRMSRHNKRLPC
jgi:hypothetical protein